MQLRPGFRERPKTLMEGEVDKSTGEGSFRIGRDCLF